MVFPGGELSFILNMIEDSVRLGARIHWYSSMVGKKVTLKAIRKELHSRHVTAIRTTEFAQVGCVLISIYIPPCRHYVVYCFHA